MAERDGQMSGDVWDILLIVISVCVGARARGKLPHSLYGNMLLLLIE
jgi:hypothetical protein